MEVVGISGDRPFIPCLPGTTVRVECVSSVSEDELEPTEGDGEGVLELEDEFDSEDSERVGGGLGIVRAASISWACKARKDVLKRCIKSR